MRFRVLGTVDVVADGRAVALPAGRARTVLAMLVLFANRPVSVDELIEAAWNGRPPTTARTQLHSLVSALRRALTAAGFVDPPAADVIATASPGYLLRVEPGDTDLAAFEAGLGAARAAAARGDAATAVAACDAALRLWRGRPFEGIASHHLDVEATRLDEARLHALEDCARAELALGRNGEAVARLVGLVDRSPLHEGAYELLMTALYRAGRRGDALAAYRRVRRDLVEELGVEPGPALRGLHERILAGEALPPAIGRPVRTRPAQLPADLADFTGRSRQVTELTGMLGTRGPAGGVGPVTVVSVTGAAGIGKTCLAVHVAHRVREAYPDGQLYLNLGGTDGEPLPPAQALERLLTDLGVEPAAIPATLDERASRYRSLLAGRRVLVVLDAARDAAQVRPLLPGTSGSAALVTGRSRLSGLPTSGTIELSALDDREAADLLNRIVGPERAAGEPDAVTDLVRACGGLPLALRIAGTRLANRPRWPIRSLADRLADRRRRLAELDIAGLSVRTSLESGYRALGNGRATEARGAARAFRLLGLAPVPDIPLAAVSALLDRPEPDTEAALDVLVDNHLIDEPSRERYRLSGLVRAYALERATEEETVDSLREAVRRLVCWYRHALAAARRALATTGPLGVTTAGTRSVRMFQSREQARDWLRRERANLPAVADLARAAERPGFADVTGFADGTGFADRIVAPPWRRPASLTAGRAGTNHR
jgi:DNA-binding SARP family transcriptional activator